jgi:hypothetical protein
MYRDPEFEVLLRALPEPLVVLTPDLSVRHVNAAFLATTGVTEREMLDRHLIDEVFPDKPGAAAPGRLKLRNSFQMVRRTGVSDVAGVSRYDLPAAGSTQALTRWWSPVNSPIVDDRGVVRFIVHRVQDVTAARNTFAGLVASAAAVMGGTQLPPGQREEMISAADNCWAVADRDGQLAEQLADLRQILDARSVIEQAKGMLMASRRITADRAFALLREESQFTNVKLRDVAAQHVLLRSTP